jgi:hypothetical protein
MEYFRYNPYQYLSSILLTLGKQTMQLIQKHIISISVVALLAIVVGYFVVQNNTSSISDRVNINTISQSGRETDTLKRLETVAHSGTGWGVSPFGSGKPLTEGEMKPEFKKPNTEWKTRTLSGITYEFGKGNPKEVHPKFENFQGWDSNGYYQDETVRPKVETLLVEFLSNPILVTVINKCGSLATPGNTSSPLAMRLPGVLFMTDFSIEGMFTINPSTGRKQLDQEKFNLFGIVFSQIRDQEEGYTKKRLVNKLANECLSENEIVNYDQLVDQYNAINNSWMNSSPENRKEICDDLRIENCNYEN